MMFRVVISNIIFSFVPVDFEIIFILLLGQPMIHTSQALLRFIFRVSVTKDAAVALSVLIGTAFCGYPSAFKIFF